MQTIQIQNFSLNNLILNFHFYHKSLTNVENLLEDIIEFALELWRGIGQTFASYVS